MTDTPSGPDLRDDEQDETEVFVALMNRHQARLAAFVESLVPDFQSAQDLLQNTNLVLWRKRAEFRPGSNFWAWACSVGYREVQHYRRSQGRSKLVFGDALTEQLTAVATDRLDAHEDRCRLLRLCLEQLPTGQRQLIEKRYAEADSVKAIARQQGVSANAVSKLLQRSRQALLRCIEQKRTSEESS